MTGRKGRLVRSGEGGTGVVYEARNASGVEAGVCARMGGLYGALACSGER